MRFTVFFSAAMVAACRDQGIDESEDVSTRDMQVVVAVNGEAGRTVVRARASALLPYSGALTLTGGDRLLLRGVGEMQRDATGDYVAIAAREGGSFIVDLLRPNDRPLTDLEISVPPPFALTASATRVRWDQRIDLTWDRADGDHVTSVEWTGGCTKRVLRHLTSDTGAYTLNAAEIHRADPTASCPVTVTIARQAPSRSSRTLYATAKQSRSVEIAIDP